MPSRHHRRCRWLLSLALCAAFALCGAGIASAATYEEGGGAATPQKSPWRWTKQREARPIARRPARALLNLPPSGKKISLQKKQP